MRWRLTAVGLLLCSCAAPAPPRDSPYSLQLKPYVGGLRTLEAGSPVNGRVLFDTGGGLTLLGPAAAAKIGCVPYSRVSGLRMNGERFDFDTCGQAPISFGPFKTQAETGVFDLMGLLPEGFPQLDGLASLQTFSGHVVVIDLGENRLEVHTTRPRMVEGMSEVPIRFSRCCAGIGLDAFVQVQGGKGPLWFELDSGNLDRVLIPRRILDQLSLPDEKLQSLKAGSPTDIPIEITGLGVVEVTAQASDIIYDGALNAKFLERTSLVLDLPQGRGWIGLKE